MRSRYGIIASCPKRSAPHEPSRGKICTSPRAIFLNSFDRIDRTCRHVPAYSRYERWNSLSINSYQVNYRPLGNPRHYSSNIKKHFQFFSWKSFSTTRPADNKRALMESWILLNVALERFSRAIKTMSCPFEIVNDFALSLILLLHLLRRTALPTLRETTKPHLDDSSVLPSTLGLTISTISWSAQLVPLLRTVAKSSLLDNFASFSSIIYQ